MDPLKIIIEYDSLDFAECERKLGITFSHVTMSILNPFLGTSRSSHLAIAHRIPEMTEPRVKISPILPSSTPLEHMPRPLNNQVAGQIEANTSDAKF